MRLYSSVADIDLGTTSPAKYLLILAGLRLEPMASCPPPATRRPMGRFFDFAKRRIAGYIVFWVLVLLFLGLFYQGDPPAQAGGLFILGLAFIGSLLYTRRMKRKQRARRETDERAKQMQQAYEAQRMRQTQQTRQTGGR